MAHVPRRAIGIVRVSSTKGREGESFHSPRTQLERIREDCARAGEELIAHFEELDVSGTRPLERRPGLKRALDAIEQGRADVIVVAYFDRLVRSVKVQAEVVERVERAGGDVRALDAGQITNGKAATRLQANMLGAIAQFWSDQTRDKTREAQERAVAMGVPPLSHIPPGYVRGPERRLVPDLVLAPVVVEMFEMRARGVSINELRKFLLEHGVKRTYGGVAQMLSRRIYLGELHFGDLVNLEAHEPIVDRVVFDRVQGLNLPRAQPPRPSDRLLARLGVLRCAHCGGRLVVKPGGDRKRADGSRVSYAFYWCRGPDCTQRVSIHAPVVEAAVVEHVLDLIGDIEEQASELEDVKALEAAYEASERGLKRAFTLATAAGLDGDVSAAERLSELRRARDEARSAFEAARDADAAVERLRGADWERLSREAQRQIIRDVVELVEVRRGGRGAERLRIVSRVL